MAIRSSNNQGKVSEGIDFKRMMLDGSYSQLIGQYDKYIAIQLGRIRKEYKGGTVLSVGCGDGEIESRLPFPVVCYDIHDAAKILHPELDFRYEWPEDKFDLVLCLGAVLSYIHPNEQPQFIERLLCSTKDTGRIVMTGIGYSGSQGETVYPTTYPSHPKIKVY